MNEESYPNIAKEIASVLKSGGVYFSKERDVVKYRDVFVDLGLAEIYSDNFTAIFHKRT